MSERHSNKRKLLLSSGAVDMGCGCRKFAKLFSFLQTKPKFTTSPSSSSPSASVSASSSSVYRHGFSGEKSNYSLRYLLDAERAFKSPVKPVKGFGRIDDEGIAVEKDSDDPYLDFRQSMLQMILGNGIYSKDDMWELLSCFLQLNIPYYHGVIVRAFTEIWSDIFSVGSAPPDSNPYPHHPSPLAWEC